MPMSDTPQSSVSDLPTPAILRPWQTDDAISIGEAQRLTGEGRMRLIALADRHKVGRKIGERWAFSRVALLALLHDDRPALHAYLAGDRSSPTVARAYRAAGVSLPAGRAT